MSSLIQGPLRQQKARTPKQERQKQEGKRYDKRDPLRSPSLQSNPLRLPPVLISVEFTTTAPNFLIISLAK